MAEMWNLTDMQKIMKQYIRFAALVATLVAGVSCMKENAVPAVREGESVELSLNVTSGALEQVIVKGWDPNVKSEATVNNLRVYIFSENGSIIGYKYFASEDLDFKSDRNATSGYDLTSALTGIKTVTGKAYIYAIANAITSQYQISDSHGSIYGDIDENNVAASGLTREKFLAATYSRQSGAYDPRDNTFMMTGYVNGGQLVTIERVAGTAGTAVISSPASDDAQRIKLYKVVSKNKLTISTAAGISFDPDYMEIHNVPRLVAMAPDGTAEASSFEDIDRVVLDENIVNFYLPENRQSANLKGNAAKWSDREKNTYSGAEKSFVNAPDSATFLVVHGRYQSGDYVGNVAYTMHLGDFGKNGSLDNYDVCRNYSYQYSLTISGVNSFIAEARRDGEGTADDPGSEGIVIKTATTGMLEVDSHYEARVMNFSMAEIKELIDDKFGYILKIHTAFGETECLIVTDEGVFDAAAYYYAMQTGNEPQLLSMIRTDGSLTNPENLLISGEPDFGWVHFVRNTGVSGTSAAASPGCRVDANHTYVDACAYPGTSNTMNVFQFLQKLYVAAKNSDTSFFDRNGYAYVTCFVDENYYPEKNWTDYVNKSDNRLLYIANSFDVSNDEKSSYAEAKYVISQKSIWTFYSMDDASICPYGVETLSEEEDESGLSMTYSKSGYDYDDWKGYTVASSYLTDMKYVTSSGTGTGTGTGRLRREGKQDLYSEAYMACTSRNRDENGDGVIEADEIKWYLAAVDQYKGIWIGEKVLPTEVKLFQPTDANWNALNTAYKASGSHDSGLKPWHFFTASSQGVFWPEEGASTSESNGSWGVASKVRCVRTLESGQAGSGKQGLKDPDAFYENPVKNSDGSYDVTIRMAEQRGFQSAPMQPSLERGEASNNDIYPKIRIDASNIGTNYTRGQIISSVSAPDDFIGAYEDVCWTGKNADASEPWRVPNEKELLLMSVLANDGSIDFSLSVTNFIWSNTYFTGLVKDPKKFNPNTTLTGSYYKAGSVGSSSGVGLVMFSNGRFSISPDKSSGTVRCVRDVK